MCIYIYIHVARKPDLPAAEASVGAGMGATCTARRTAGRMARMHTDSRSKYMAPTSSQLMWKRPALWPFYVALLALFTTSLNCGAKTSCHSRYKNFTPSSFHTCAPFECLKTCFAFRYGTESIDNTNFTTEGNNRCVEKNNRRNQNLCATFY